MFNSDLPTRVVSFYIGTKPLVDSKGSVDTERNQRIVLVRLLCIFGMIYVHVPALEPNFAMASVTGYFHFDFIRMFIVEGYGRASACLLSVVSGYLVSITLCDKTISIQHFYKRRFKSIYLPMVLWGLMSILLFSLVSLLQPTFLHEVCGFAEGSLLSCLNVVFHLAAMSEGPTMHLAFLRDLFICILLAPALIYLTRNIPIILLVVLTAVYIIDLESILILRPLVILGFSVGIWIGLNRFNALWVDKLWVLWLGFWIVTTLIIIAYSQGQLPLIQWTFASHGLDAKESLLYPLSRLFGALSIWTIAAKLLSLNSLRWCCRLEPYLFAAFCAHPLILVVIQSTGVFLLQDQLVNQFYPMWFLVAPAVAIACARTGTVCFSYVVPPLVGVYGWGRRGVVTQFSPT